MEDATHEPPAATSRPRRPRVGGMPSAPTALILVALVAVALVVGDSSLTITVLARALRSSKIDGWLVTAVFALLTIASIMVTRPLIRAIKRWREVRRALTRNDIVAARLARTSARDQSWIAIGYSLGQFIVVLACQFLLANHQAVARTFFFC